MPIIFLVIYFCYFQLRNCAQQFGEQVKAAFDVYLPPLALALGYELSADREKNTKFWLAFSQMMIYREPRSLDQMASAGLRRIPALQIESNSTPESVSDESNDPD